MKKLIFLIMTLCNLQFAKCYQGQQYPAYNPFLEYAFTMMYAEVGMTKCSVIIQCDKEELISSMSSIFSMLDSFGLQGFSSANVIEGINNAYNYCQLNPEALFAVALANTLRPGL